jgi:peptidoglycan hydrolase-like protein with peptidoglycan-binding domain
LGNRRVAQLIRARRLTPQGKIIGLQRKLTVGAADDQYEQEADHVANRVMSMPDAVPTNSMHPAIAKDTAEEDKEQTLQTKPLAASITPLVQGQMENTEESEDKEMPLQARFSEVRGRPMQRQTVAEEEKAESIQASSAGSPSDSFEAGADVESQLDRSKGGGSPLPDSVRAFMEPRFGVDFSQVRTHTGSEAVQMNREVGAKAFTHGSDIYYGAGNNPNNLELTAHELTHVVQQKGGGVTLRRQHVADTGFRYTPPASVTRSIVEIQGVVGTTPDGVYGENTRIAVEKYQTKLKDIGFYSDTLDGKWGKNTEAAHEAFATAPNVERRGYNCAGFAFKDYKFHSLAATKTIYSSMTKLADCSKSCSPYFHKFWMWEFDAVGINTAAGTSTAPFKDFHTVGGQTNGSGTGPDQVMSKNGQRPVQGPKPPLDWEPVSGPALSQITGLPVPNRFVSVSNTALECFCNDKLP